MYDVFHDRSSPPVRPQGQSDLSRGLLTLFIDRDRGQEAQGHCQEVAIVGVTVAPTCDLGL